MTVHVTQGNSPASVTSPQAYGSAVWNGAGWESDLASEQVDICAEFGVSTTNADNSTAINTALATLGPLGLEAFVSKPGVYAIKNPIVIGNGSTSAFSTWSARLVMAGMPGDPTNVTGFNVGTVQSKLQWQGAAGMTDAMLQVLGPVKGWGLRNVRLDGGPTVANAPGWALRTTSASRGDVVNFVAENCQSACVHNTIASRSGALTGIVCDDIFNIFRNVGLHWIGKSGAKTYGILFDGNNVTGNACFDQYEHLWLTSPINSYGGATHNYNIYFRMCDSNRIRSMTMNNTGAGSDPYHHVFYDWTGGNTYWPKGNIIDIVDFGTTSPSYIGYTGTPSGPGGGGLMSYNRILNVSGANGQPSGFSDPRNAQFVPYLQYGQPHYYGYVVLDGTGAGATVAHQAIIPGSFVDVSTLAPGGSGALGSPYVASRGSGTMTINSTSATDTATILWKILGPPF